MSYLGIVITAVFASNALLTYGFGAIPERGREERASLALALALVCVNALASTFLWAIRTLALSPLGLGSVDILFFMIAAVPLLRFISRAASTSNKPLIARIGASSDDLIVGSLVFGVALVSARSAFTLPEAAVASAASGLGYWMAQFLLESVRERLELSDVPAPFKGAPAMLISAGLMSLAFMSVDAAFIKNLVG
jgi:Na+-translocating ferredoxin:NAD+ oxidoreductase subunit A